MKRILLIAGWAAALVLTGCAVTLQPIGVATSESPPVADTGSSTQQPATIDQPASTVIPIDESPFVPDLTRLTEPGCCVQPVWSPDGQQVRFVDKRPGLPVSAIYGVDIANGEVEVVSRIIGLLSPGDRYIAYLNADYAVVVQNQQTGIRTIVPSEGQAVFFSPNNKRIAWQVIRQVGIYGQRRSEISVATINGQNARQLISATGGSIIGWLDDDHLLLLAGMPGKDANHRALFSIAVDGEGRVDLINNDRIVAAGIAPGGEWVRYAIAFSPEDSANDGLWIVRRDGTDHHQIDVFGAPQWRDANHLLIVPERTINGSHYLLQLNAETGELVALTDPAAFSFKIESGEWKVSPTGDRVVFLNAADSALWVFDLPPLAGP